MCSLKPGQAGESRFCSWNKVEMRGAGHETEPQETQSVVQGQGGLGSTKGWVDHLDFAISEFREMKIQLSPERALRHTEIQGA